METTQPDDETFLRDLVKMSRQRIHYVQWVDRDGTKRQTSLTQPEVVRLNILADKEKTNKGEILRRAAHVPVPKRPPAPPTA